MVIKKKKKVLHLCPEKFRMFTRMWSVSVGKFVLEMIFFAVVINVFDVVTSLYTNHHDRSPSLVRHTYHCPIITVIHCADWSANPDVKNVFLFISVVVYVDAATAWSNDSPVFLFFSFFVFFPQMDPALLFIFFLLHFIPPTFFSPFYFVDLFVFWRQQVGIDQGDIPDLSQVSVHLTFHFLFSLFPTLVPFSRFPSYLIGFFSGFPLTPSLISLLPLCVRSLHHTLFHPYIYLCSPSFPNYSLILSSSLSTHSFFFQTTISSNLIWVEPTPLWFDWFPALSFTSKCSL